MRFLDICDISGKSVSKFSGNKKYIATGDIVDNIISSYSIVTYENKPSRANIEIDENEILFAKMINTRKVLVSNSDNINNIYSTGFYCLKPKENIDINYLYYFINSESFNKQKDKNCSGATQKAINNEGLEKIIINNVPSINDQRKVAKKLKKIDNLVSVKKEQIKCFDELIKSQFVEMFGINKKSNFPTDKLDNLTLKITDGKHGGCNGEEHSGYYFVGATEIYNDKINYETAKEITENDFIKDYKRCNLKNYDFVIVNTGATIGKSAIVDSDLAEHTLLQKSVALIRTKQEIINPIYLKYCYDANPDMYNKGNGCARINLLLSQIKETVIPVPPIELQNQFADFVKLIDKQKFVIVNIVQLLVKNGNYMIK